MAQRLWEDSRGNEEGCGLKLNLKESGWCFLFASTRLQEEPLQLLLLHLAITEGMSWGLREMMAGRVG